MVSLAEVCKAVLKKHSKEQIFRVCEYDTAFECLLINKNEDPIELRKQHGILPAVVCYKRNGKIIEDLFPGEWCNYDKEPYRYYEAEEIANLLREERRGA